MNLTGGWGRDLFRSFCCCSPSGSMVVNYLYAENNLIFLKLNSRPHAQPVAPGHVADGHRGFSASMPVVWQLADVIMALMAIANLTAILLLSPVVTLIARDYLRQRKLGFPPVFDASRYPEIKSQIAPGTWDDVVAAITAIDQFRAIFAKVALNFLQGLDMLILISPAKTLDYQSPLATERYTQPELLDYSQQLIHEARKLSAPQIASLMSISDKLADLNATHFHGAAS